MASNKLFLSLLTFSLLFNFSFSVVDRGSWQYGQCQVDKISAREPTYRVQAEGGESVFWDHNTDEFQCAGVSLQRHTIRPRALRLPSYENGPVLVYVLQGRGIFGVMVSGCPETYESSSSQQQYYHQEEKVKRFRDRHQKIGHYKKGDIMAIPAGAAHWSYNAGDEDAIILVLLDNTNFANQLDPNPRSFFLAGNPESQLQAGNVFRGFDLETLSEAFGIDQETVRKLRGEGDQRGHFVIVERGLQVITPSSSEEDQVYKHRRLEGSEDYKNGLEETICTARVRENIDTASRADVYNPRAGMYTIVNSLTLPILQFLQLSVAKGVLYGKGMMAPHWHVNSHALIYITRGKSRVQIVNHNGRAVFDGRVEKGQALVVPQNFAVVKQAGEQGCEWIEFRTSDNSMITTLSGRTSVIRALPVDVIRNMYQMTREEAENLKYSRQETLLFTSNEAE